MGTPRWRKSAAAERKSTGASQNPLHEVYFNQFKDAAMNAPYASIVMLLLFLVAFMYRLRKPKGRGRSMSFNSWTLIDGSFPAATNVPSPLINTVLLFEKCPSMEKIEETINGMQTFDRFRMIPKYDSRSGSWIFDDTCPPCKNADMISSVQVNGEEEMLAAVHKEGMSDIAGYNETPAFRLFRVENRGIGLSAVVIRVHHVIGDGISLVAAMNNVFTDMDGTPVRVEIPQITGSIHKTQDDNRKSDSKIKTKDKKSFFSLGLFTDLLVSFFKVLALPAGSYDSDILFTTKDKSKLTMTPSRKFVYFPTARLDFVKALKNKAAVTVNDVMMAATAGAIRRYCLARKDPLLSQPGKRTLNRALIPVAFPRAYKETTDPSKAMRNKWAFVSSELPIGLPTCSERLRACSASMSTLKQSPMAFVQLWVQTNLLPLLPAFLRKGTGLDLFKRHSMVFSNVPGPDKTFYFAGEQMVGIQVLFPNLLTQTMIISYNGGLFMNMVLDDELITECEQLKKFYREEMKELATEYGIPSDESEIFLPPTHSGAQLSAVKDEVCCS